MKVEVLVNVYLHEHESGGKAESQLDRLEQILRQVRTYLEKNMALLDDKISELTTQVEQNTSVTASGAAVIRGFAQLLADAIAAATAAGASAAQLAKLTELQTAIGASASDLAAAIAENTDTPQP
jgi:DNA repair exonuclease SbcCD ATPase subunit